MKDLMQRLKTFLIFDGPVNYNYLIVCFRQTHRLQCSSYPNWPTKATSRRLVSDYWVNVSRHYLLILAMGILTTLLFSDQKSAFNGTFISVLTLTGFIAYLPLYFIVYRPTFVREFLPRLLAVTAQFEGSERLYLEKCKQAQMSNTALSIVFYALAKTSGIQLNKVDTQLGGLLMNLYGSSPDSLQKALKLITCKVASLTPHKLTELEKSLEEARVFFTKLEFLQGLKIVDHLEYKFKRL